MYTLVAEVEQYPDFLPWCQNAHIIDQDENSFIADLTIGYKAFVHTFRSRVSLTKPTEIKVEYVQGSMKYLKNYWKFRDLPNQCCEVDFLVDFSFGLSFLQIAVEMVFSKAVHQITQAFEERAKVIYGPPGIRIGNNLS
jgi:coenzyme Q-binding protein COQ10